VLKQRILTALVLLPVVMAAIFALPAIDFMLLFAVLLLLGSMEFRRLAGLQGLHAGNVLILVQLAIFTALLLTRKAWQFQAGWFLVLSCAAWLLMFLRLWFFKPDTLIDRGYRIISFMTALVSISTGWFALSWLRAQPTGAWLVLLLLLIVWAADTGAYFFGKSFGKTKLAPQISPGKTVAGLIGGLLAATAVSQAAIHWMPLAAIEPVRLAALALLTALASAGGDLLVSMHKRTSGYKDAGHLLPGHGGILDRLDSLVSAAPFFALGLLAMGI